MTDTVRDLTFLPPTKPGDPARVEGVRDARYGEVLLVRADGDRLIAEVWNTLGLNDCPDEAWRSLDPAAIVEQTGALGAILNGPRHWLMDAIENVEPGARRLATFGPLDLFLAAAVDLGDDVPDRRPYHELRVERSTVFEWDAGRTVHELVDADGRSWVMQSYSLELEPGLDEGGLADVGARISPPPGWSFRSRRLDGTLRVVCSGGVAVITQDDLQNTYQLLAAPA